MWHRPSKVDIALRYYYLGSIAGHPDIDMEHGTDLQELLSEGILRRHTAAEGPGLLMTERGEAWIRMLCETPYPEARWTDPRTETMPRTRESQLEPEGPTLPIKSQSQDPHIGRKEN